LKSPNRQARYRQQHPDAFVVTWRGRLIAERYGNGITVRTPLEGWSMGKSLTATLITRRKLARLRPRASQFSGVIQRKIREGG
jgi:hypothetical protein